MKKASKVWLLIAAILSSVGLSVIAVSWAAVGFDFQKLDTVEPTSGVYEFAESFDQIVIGLDTADIRFAVSEDGVARVAIHERNDSQHSVVVADGKLIIRSPDEPWYKGLLGFYFGREEITVFLPEDAVYSLMARGNTGDVTLSSGLTFGEVRIENDTGEVRIASEVRGMLSVEIDTGYVFIENTSTASIEVGTDTGDVIIRNTQVSGVIGIETDTGDVKLKDTVAVGDVYIETDTGDVTFDKFDAANLTVLTDTGDVEGTLLSDKTFDARSGTGSERVPSGTVGGICKITTNTGDIEIRIVK